VIVVGDAELSRPLDLHVDVVAIAGEARLVGQVLGPVHEVLAGAEIEGVDVGGVGDDRPELARVPLAEEVVLLAQALQQLNREGPVGHPLPDQVLLGGDLGLERLQARHVLVDGERRAALGPAPPDVPKLPFRHRLPFSAEG
jgi:hypothetical protein